MSTPAKYNIIGNPNTNRRDITRKITGAAIYAWDINPAHIGVSPTPGGMVYLGVVTCPYPRAKIVSIDVSAVKAAGYWALTGRRSAPICFRKQQELSPAAAKLGHDNVPRSACRGSRSTNNRPSRRCREVGQGRIRAASLHS